MLVRQLVSCIHSLLQGMNAREDIYSLGHTARIVGTELDALTPARLRRKVCFTVFTKILSRDIIVIRDFLP